MSPRRTPDALTSRVKKLAELAAARRQGASFNITRLTVVKRLCAERTQARLLKEVLPSPLASARWERFKTLVGAGVEAMPRYLTRMFHKPVKPTPMPLTLA